MASNDPLTIIHGDALSALRGLESESVQTCCTSPPYWGLRSYGTEPIVWGGDRECEHEWIDKDWYRNGGGRTAGGNFIEAGAANAANIKESRWMVDSSCMGCGAWRGELGLEPTPEMYVAHLVEVFREMKRVLRNDGTLWLNLGDSYASTPPGNRTTGVEKWATSGLHGARISAKYAETLDRSVGQKRNTIVGGLKPKDLVGIPWMVAFALRADGWYLRSDIIWAKPNPMPESVTDRPTKSHEYIFLLSKSERYYYDAVVIQEEAASGMDLGLLRGKGDGNDPRVAWHAPSIRARQSAGVDSRSAGTGWRNKRSVWTVATTPFPDAHFATFPPDLIKPCVLAGSKPGDVVIDPFGGSGTTGKVAIELGRKAILIEPKAEYIEMIKRRCQTTIGLPLAI